MTPIDIRLQLALVIPLAGFAQTQVLPYPDYSNQFFLQPLVESRYFTFLTDSSAVFTEEVVREYRTNAPLGNPGPYGVHGFTPVTRYMGNAGGRDGGGDLGEKTYGYSTVFGDLESKLKAVLAGNGSFGIACNGNRWDFAYEGPLGFVRSHEVEPRARRDPDSVGHPGWSANAPRWMMRDATGKVKYHKDGMGLVCNARYNTVHRTYKRRNIDALMVRVDELWRKYPRQFSFLNGDSETEQPNGDENPLTRLEFQDWVNHRGIYDPGTVTVSLWYHPGQTGVDEVVYDPGGAALALAPAAYRFQGWPDLSDAQPGYGFILLNNLAALGGGPGVRHENKQVAYKVVGGSDAGKIFTAKAEYFGDQGRQGGTGDYTHFMKAVNDFMIEDYIKWMHLKLVELGHPPDKVRSRLFSHEVGVERNSVTFSFYDDRRSTTVESRYGSGGVTKYKDLSAANAMKFRDNTPDGYRHWGNFEWNRFGNTAETEADIGTYLKYGAHALCANGFDIGRYDIHRQVGYRSAARNTVRALGWRPWKMGADNSLSAPATAYLPPAVKAAAVELSMPGQSILSWSPYIWEDLTYPWSDWPDFTGFDILRDGLVIANTRESLLAVPYTTGVFSIRARSIAGPGAESRFGAAQLGATVFEAIWKGDGIIQVNLKRGMEAVPFGSSSFGGHWTLGNLNTWFKTEAETLSGWTGLEVNHGTGIYRPAGIRITPSAGKTFQFGDLQGVRFQPPKGWTVDSVAFAYENTAGPQAFFEVWSGDGVSVERRVGDALPGISGSASVGVPTGSDAWVEFRLTIGQGGAAEKSSPARMLAVAGAHATARDISIQYRKAIPEYGQTSLEIMTEGNLRIIGAPDSSRADFRDGRVQLLTQGQGTLRLRLGTVSLECEITAVGIQGKSGGSCQVADASIPVSALMRNKSAKSGNNIRTPTGFPVAKRDALGRNRVSAGIHLFSE